MNVRTLGRGRELSQRGWFVLLSAYMLALVGFGLAVGPLRLLWPDLLRILTTPGMLVTDYMAVGGLGAALVNAGLVGLAGLLLVRANGVLLSGPTVAAVFTMAGFGLFGKNVWSIWPIIFGVGLFSLAVRRPLKSYILVALFGTALAPLVTQVAFGLRLGLIPGVLAGVTVGFLLPPVAVYMLRLHQGYNIYNVGLTCGFVGLFITALLVGLGADTSLPFFWSREHGPLMSWFVPLYVGSMLAVGIWLKPDLAALPRLVKEAGTLPTDFVELHGAGTVWINMGLVGLIGWGYIVLVGGDLNGPTIGGVMTMVGFAAFGKHPLNVLPIMLGVYLGSRLMIWEPNQAGPLLAALFATTLAPLSGRFGPLMGILAGGIHLMVVMRTAPWHAGLNLYNNGFAGGLTATLIVSLVNWWSAWREEHGKKRK